MQKITDKQALIFVIDKLVSGRYFGHHQMLEDNLAKGKPKEDAKLIKEAGDRLFRMGFLTKKKKHYGFHISVIPKRAGELKAFRESLERT